jgi:hypothetical protein
MGRDKNPGTATGRKATGASSTRAAEQVQVRLSVYIYSLSLRPMQCLIAPPLFHTHFQSSNGATSCLSYVLNKRLTADRYGDPRMCAYVFVCALCLTMRAVWWGRCYSGGLIFWLRTGIWRVSLRSSLTPVGAPWLDPYSHTRLIVVRLA